MLSKIFSVSILALILVLIDLYVFQAIKVVLANSNQNLYRVVSWIYWTISLLSVIGVFYYNFGNLYFLGKYPRSYLITPIVIGYFSKLFAIVVLFVDDSRRAVQWAISLFSSPSPDLGVAETDVNKISRSDFLAKTAIISAVVPFVTMGYGIISGAHDYRLRRKTIFLKGLPKAFDGVRIGQLSDIHSGSFFNKKAVKGGVEMLLNEKVDLFFFTGDLVNNEAEEVGDYIDIFSKIKAPLGSFSILGNHDYGDYRRWDNASDKIQNLNDLKKAHKALGWDLLLNENRMIKVGNDEIAVLGCENWGAGRFQKYGDMQATYAGVSDVETKILLSHDPSHWDAQIRPNYKDIDLVLAGHTHGFQFGVEIGGFKWSPSQYFYKQWAGLYQEENQYIYVNRGFGFIGYPGRIGIPPEITILELKSA